LNISCNRATAVSKLRGFVGALLEESTDTLDVAAGAVDAWIAAIHIRPDINEVFRLL